EYAYDFLALHGVVPASNITLLKVDIEGYDFKAIRGMKKSIEASPNIKIIVEFFPKKLEAAGDSPEEFISYLKAQGFKVDYLNHNEYFNHGTNPIIRHVSYQD